MVITDGAGTIVLVNHQLETQFGYERTELLGNTVDALLPERLRAPHGDHRTRYAEAPRTRGMGTGQALIGRRADGSEFPVEVSLSPVSTSAGTFVVAAVRDITERRAVDEQLQRAAQDVRVLADRDRIARDLHDEIIQAVYAAGLNLQAARSEDEVTKDQALVRAGEELRAVIADLRSFIRHLTTDAEEALPGAILRTRIEELAHARSGPPQWSLLIDLGDEPLPRDLHRELFLMARELISNVERHAGARHARLTLRVVDGHANLVVSDDGAGFRRTEVQAESVGLRGLERRVADLGGSVLIRSAPGEGTSVTARVPATGG